MASRSSSAADKALPVGTTSPWMSSLPEPTPWPIRSRARSMTSMLSSPVRASGAGTADSTATAVSLCV